MSGVPAQEIDRPALAAALSSAVTFEAIADLVLRSMLDTASRAIRGSPFAGSGSIVRAIVFLRPDDDYRSVGVRDATSDTVPVAWSGDVRLPSATAWRWVAESRQPIAIDVLTGGVVLGVGEQETVSPRRFGQGASPGGESRMRLLQRDVTHLLVLPLRGATGRIDGMLALEARCKEAAGRAFVWSACARHLQDLADLAAPHFFRVPGPVAAPEEYDHRLPVVGASMAPTIGILRAFARQADPILISGPTGVGKSRLARWCHEQSEVAAQPFEVLDLAAIPEELQLAELFGWRKGAFTGAVRDNAGVIARAKGGTLFIDEIDNLSPRAQAGLLRVLEEGRFRALGDEGSEREAQVRFIIGTNARLAEAVREHRFREDLYYRINVLPVRLPALRERADEIVPWARYFARRHHTRRHPEGAIEIDAKAEAILQRYSWPGNLRQLDNVVRRAYAMALLPQETVPASVRVEEAHLRAALTQDGAPFEPPLLTAMSVAASAFAEEVVRRGADEVLDLDLADGFRTMVLAATVRRLGGDRDAALRALGRGGVVEGRQQNKLLRRELERAQRLYATLGFEAPLDFAELARDRTGTGCM